MTKYFIIGLSVLLLGCREQNVKCVIPVNVEQAVIKDTIKKKTEIKKDSIDILIEKRAFKNLNSSIFAGLKFGDSPQHVESALQNEQNKRIQVPMGDKVSTIHIESYDAEYYKDQLASLILYAEQDELYEGLVIVYSTKYGITKRGQWHFANCSIELRYGFRREYDVAKEAGYNSSGPTLYYDGFRKQRTSYITRDGYFLKIEYKNNHLLKLIERGRTIADSLENIRKLRAVETEKELAKKLRTETAINI